MYLAQVPIRRRGLGMMKPVVSGLRRGSLRRELRRRLGQITTGIDLYNDVANPGVPSSQQYIPGSTVSDYLMNAATGQLTQNQLTAIQNEGAQEIETAAAGNEDLAQQQIAAMIANTNAVTALNGGVASLSLSDPTTWPWWMWAALAGGVLIAYGALK
jgi:hypothetical protein